MRRCEMTNADGSWTSSRELTAEAARRLLEGQNPVAVLAFLRRHVKSLEAT
jgi:hypothetical protein